MLPFVHFLTFPFFVFSCRWTPSALTWQCSDCCSWSTERNKIWHPGECSPGHHAKLLQDPTAAFMPVMGKGTAMYFKYTFGKSLLTGPWWMLNKCIYQTSLLCERGNDKPSEEDFNVQKQPFLRHPQHLLAAKGAVVGTLQSLAVQNGPWSLGRLWGHITFHTAALLLIQRSH